MNLAQNPQVQTKTELESNSGGSALGMLVLVVVAIGLLVYLATTKVQQSISENQAIRANAQVVAEQARAQQEKELTERARINQEAERHNAELRATNVSNAMSMLIPILGLAGLAMIYTVINHRLDIQTMQREDHAATMRIHTLQEEQKLLAMQMSQVYYLPKPQTTVNQEGIWQ